MRRQNLYFALVFLAGTLTGALAMGARQPGNDSMGQDGRTVRTGAAEQSAATEAGGPPPGSEPLAATLSVASEDPSEPDRAEAPPDLENRLQTMAETWTGLQEDVARLQGRLDGLERRLAAVTAREPAAVAAAERPQPEAPGDRRSALVKAGVAEDRAADIVWRLAQQELDRLELRDIATREGWFGSDRYRDELDRVREDAVDLPSELGADSYDRYLYATGEDNRVAIESIIPGSVAEESGLEPGDLVESYGGNRVFRFRDLRAATAEGERGELVPVRIRRGEDVVDAWLPRGPLGVRLNRARVDPEG